MQNDSAPRTVGETYFFRDHGQFDLLRRVVLDIVRALRLGAADFVQKPVDEQLLFDRIQEALART